MVMLLAECVLCRQDIDVAACFGGDATLCSKLNAGNAHFVACAILFGFIFVFKDSFSSSNSRNILYRHLFNHASFVL